MYILQCPEIDNICIIGDSIALRMVKTITQDNSNGRFLLCQGGLTTEILKDNLKTNYLNYQQKDVLVMIGTNDILQNVESEIILKNLSEIITELHRKKVGVIYLVTIPLSPKLALHNDGNLEKLNEEIIKLDSLENNVNVIDCQDVFVNNGEVCMKYFEKSYAEGKCDNVHPNSHGLETLYECITSNMP
ncbi:N-acylneuraminate cytidylyltransferase [Frankliniella fusca]|uniref:N-acylneuraminate cytidylyltransferase n=1 Tax=Frankliniella fusca TaxID=407009 RepID=A0AAE1I4J5_9NEOP|nr:N-acylneuraminate cytidylyltransferase [Frankliniella fusca]